jgi:hypothetical protein
MAPPGRVSPRAVRVQPRPLPRPEPVMEYGPRASLPPAPGTDKP